MNVSDGIFIAVFKGSPKICPDFRNCIKIRQMKTMEKCYASFRMSLQCIIYTQTISFPEPFFIFDFHSRCPIHKLTGSNADACKIRVCFNERFYTFPVIISGYLIIYIGGNTVFPVLTISINIPRIDIKLNASVFGVSHYFPPEVNFFINGDCFDNLIVFPVFRADHIGSLRVVAVIKGNSRLPDVIQCHIGVIVHLYHAWKRIQIPQGECIIAVECQKIQILFPECHIPDIFNICLCNISGVGVAWRTHIKRSIEFNTTESNRRCILSFSYAVYTIKSDILRYLESTVHQAVGVTAAYRNGVVSHINVIGFKTKCLIDCFQRNYPVSFQSSFFSSSFNFPFGKRRLWIISTVNRQASCCICRCQAWEYALQKQCQQQYYSHVPCFIFSHCCCLQNIHSSKGDSSSV